MTREVIGGKMRVDVIGNDEGDVHCTLCKRRDWYQGLQFRRYDFGIGGYVYTVMCLRRFEGESCGELAKNALFETKIPGGTFDPVLVP